MLTWFDGRYLAPFPLVWFFLFMVPGMGPILPKNFPILMGKVDSGVLGYPREWLMNHIVLPVLPHDWAVSLANWWMSTGYWGEVALHLLVSLHLFVPLSLLMFAMFELDMFVRNWWSRKKYHTEVAQARRN